MKKAFTIFTIVLFSQILHSQGKNNTYELLWKQVQKYENETLTKSALEVVKSISTQAKKENNAPQIIKALLYTSKYALTLEEEAQLKIINEFKTEIAKAEFPTKNILESYLANLYWQYFQQNRYQFYDRTKTEMKVDSVDFRTWDMTTIFQDINIHFEASLINASGLQQIHVREFKGLLVEQPDSEIYRPTLFDLLAQTALNFYKTSENNINRPADKFEIDSPEMLCEANQFLHLKIRLNDKTSLQSRALSVFQQLLQFHLKDKSRDAFVDVDIERLNFINQNAIFDQKDELFIQVLKNATDNIKPLEVSALYTYEVAQLYHQQGNTYQPKVTETHRWKQKEALELCESVLLKFPKSRAAAKCRALKAQIMTPTLQMVTERFVPINTPSRMLVTYKNHSNLQLSAHLISNGALKKLNQSYPEGKQLDFINKLTVHQKWETSLTNEQDHQSHSTEILMPPLENGQYVILATPKDGSKTFAFSTIQVTNMALVESRTADRHNFQIIDRRNGKPIAGAKLGFNYQKNYDGAYLKITKDTDNMGMVSLLLTGEHWNNVGIAVNFKKDSAYFGEFYIYERQNTSGPGINNSCFLFTDRSIYRPGQPLYFKGIAIKNNHGASSILANEPVSITLTDVNNQVVGTREFKTNAYGSFAGEFILPTNGLTGNYSLTVGSKSVDIIGSAYFSVEEYKRPKFETYLEAVTESYRVNDSVTVNGNATAYAGSNITDAKVVYTVRRTVYFPRWYYWYHPYFNSEPQEIAHGETTTDASGKYSIDFKALADASVPRENLPTFSFEVVADVTDINGETHSTSTLVTVGYHTLTANMYLDNPLDKGNKDNKLTISTNNLNGQFVPASGTVKMYKLKAPEYVLRARPWAAPDFNGFGKAEFKDLFPHDAFENEHDPLNWDKGELVWESTFDTGKSKELTLGSASKWLSGAYLLELETKDKFSQVVKDVFQTTLYGKNEKSLADHQLFQIKLNKDAYSIGDEVEFTLLSSADDLDVTLFVEKDRKIIDTHLIHLNKNSKTFSVPVGSNDMGGFAVNYSFSIYNSFQTGSLPITVPYPKTDLEIETLSFRDKLRPGNDETWSFKIKGPKGDKVSAELLASMYDASLDVFRGHFWSFQPLNQPIYYSNIYNNAGQSYGLDYFKVHEGYSSGFGYPEQGYDTFDWFGFYFGYGGGYYGNVRSRMLRKAPGAMTDAMGGDEMQLEEVLVAENAAPVAKDGPMGYATPGKNRDQEDRKDNKEHTPTANGAVQMRKNFQETAFFFPQLMTDKEGNVSFEFTTPEALTKWKLQLLAHTKSLESAVISLETVTQKELMVSLNAPRFLREGDEIVISAKIANLTEKLLSGQAFLELTDAVTGDNATTKLLTFLERVADKNDSNNNEKVFKVDSMGNTQVSWKLHIPKGIQAIQYKVIARAEDFSDGEQSILPVLTNRMLVTETLPMWVRGNQTKTFVMDKLAQHASTTLSNHQLTLEITSNPAWYAVQALPYLMEYAYECNEQTFAKYYANTLASHIVNGNPRIREVFDQWAGTDALVGNLEKNEELKSLLIQETPWLRDAQSESEQKKRIALLFDMNLMKNQQTMALTKLSNNQMSSGAWPWFNGGQANRFITQHIITGMGHLSKLGVQASVSDTLRYNEMIQKAIRYLDSEFVAEFDQMKQYAKHINDDHLSETQIHYLYMRSFFKEIEVSKKVVEITSYYKGQAQKYWMSRNLYEKGMLALVLDRMAEGTTSHKIIRSLEENSINNDELGMYWKENTNSWFWYQAPIETQALLIEAFSEIKKDVATVDNLKIWLLKNKQTNQWKTTKATTDAVYALLLQGSDWLSPSGEVTVQVGGKTIATDTPTKGHGQNTHVETGTGYYKTSWTGIEITSKMAKVQIGKQGAGIAWGALYWQYFEDLDKITPAVTPLKLSKKLFLKKNTETGEEITELTSKTELEVGDLLRVRIELMADRGMEFVHMKDMRAAGFEPINVFSAYKWQDGLGYYESTQDASTNFFFDYLPKGVFVFEYDLRVNNAGNFSNGITTIQSMYAPEFSSHSEGVRVSVVGAQ